jgi:hypothetical protein
VLEFKIEALEKPDVGMIEDMEVIDVPMFILE